MSGVLNRRNAGRLVLLAWAGALGWLAQRELGKSESQVIAEATIRLGPDAHFYEVVAGGRQVGYASLTIDTVPAGFNLTEVMALDVAEADSTRRVTRRTDLLLSRSLRLREFTRTVTGGGLYEELVGRVDGDSVLRFSQREARSGPAMEWTLPLAGDVVLPQVLPYRLAFSKRLEVGRAVTANVLDLNTGSIDRVEFRATAESTFVVADSAVEQRLTGKWVAITYDTLQAFRIEHLGSGGPVVSWVDDNGGAVRTESALGVRLDRSAFELVNINYRDALAERGAGHHRQVPAMRSLVIAGRRPPAGTEPAAWDVSSTAVEAFLLPRLAWLQGGRQVATGSRLEVGRSASDSGKPRTEYLGPPPPRSPALAGAAEAAGALGDAPPMIAAALVDWVARRIRIDTSRNAATGPEAVLEAGGAGAEGHARLFVELARARQISARPVSGVAVLNDGVFGHAWAEVLMDGQWVAVDPTFNQVPASNRLIRVTLGGTARPIDLVPLIGSANFSPSATASDR